MAPKPSSLPAAARSPDSAHYYHRASRWLALATAGIAGLALIGWAFGISRLTSISSDFASMKVTTAVGLLCSAGSLLLLNARPARQSPRASRAGLQPLASVFASGAGLLGLGTLVGYAANLDGESTHPGWMSPASALGFVLLALALLTCRTEGRWGRRMSEWSTLSVLFIGTVALIGYLYNEQSLYGVKPYVSMALNTALSFVLLGLGLLAAVPDRGVMATIAAQEPGGLLIRRLLPLIVTMVVAIGWIRLAGEQLGWFDRSFGLTIVVGLSLAGFSVALWAVARRLNRMAAMLRESEARLRFSLEACGIGAWDVNLLTGETDWDTMEFELLGLTPETTTPSHDAFYRRVHPEDVARVEAAEGRAVEGGELEHEFRIVRADGTIRWLVGKGLVLKDERGRPQRMVGINYDITDRKEAEATLRSFARELADRVEDRTRELARSEERLRALAAELNLVEQRERRRLATELHDYLQQTLVLGKLKLGQGKKAAEGSPAVAQIIKETDEVLSEALDYTRTLVAELSPPVLRDHGLPSALKWLANYMQKHDLSVTVGVSEGLDLALPDDQALLLFQSVRELLMNSWKYAGTGEARITMDRRADALRIEVADSGKGFDVSAAADTDASNGGLSSKFGLFSIRERMRTLGGSFEIQSAPGEGTTATLVLPLQGETGSRFEVRGSKLSGHGEESLSLNAERRTSNFEHQKNAKVRVLLVDDHAMVRQGLRSMLEAYDDVQVVGEAPDGAAAVALVGELRPSVVVMDINMPRMNGIDATVRIKTNWPETIVIGLSVNAGADNREALLRAGAALLLTKEAAVEELYGAIRQAVKVEK